MNNITYIFKEGRKENFTKNLIEAKEFYYGLPNIDKKKFNISVIEFSKNRNPISLILSLFDEFMRRIISLPFYSSELMNIKNFKTLLKSDHIVLVSEGTACSALPFLLVIKIFNKKKVSLFVMGLYSKKLKFSKLKFIHNATIKLLISCIDNVFFLGKGELEVARSLHKKKEKLHYVPFVVDTKFWFSEEKPSLSLNSQILFVGNDGNRDIDLLIDIAKNLPEHKFIFVSSIPSLQDLKIKNVRVMKGQWGSEEITDKDLREVYKKSKLTIVPLKESTQPSGQSVALQSMSIGIPVIISKTKGFWDETAFKDNLNIFFEEENTSSTWVKKINSVYQDIDLLNSISNNAKETIDNKFNLAEFDSRLNKFI